MTIAPRYPKLEFVERDPLHYSIRSVARMTGIAPDTLRAWERRYGAVTPQRTARGRAYGEAEVRRLLLLRDLVERGHAIGSVARLSEAEMAQLASTATRLGADEGGRDAAWHGLHSLLDAVEQFDYDQVNRRLEQLALMMPATDLVAAVILPLMRRAGEYWESGRFHVAHEHLVSACVRNLLGSLMRIQVRREGAPRFLFATLAGEQHEFGVLAAALLAVAHGFPAVYLGPNLPAAEILFAAAQSRPRVMVLGLMEVNATPATAAELAQVTAGLAAGVELWAGGTGAAPMAATVQPGGLVVLDDLAHYGRQLSRLEAAA